MKLQSSGGYSGLENTPLSRRAYSNTIIANIHEKDFLPDITNSELSDSITQCNQSIQIMKAPRASTWRSYQQNQPMIPSQVSVEAICLNICNAAYSDVKFDETDIHYACEMWDTFESALLESIYQGYVEIQREWVFSRLIGLASAQNQGSTAGRYGNIDLGSPGNPIVVNSKNIASEIAKLQEVLLESQQFIPGSMFLVIPPMFRIVLANSDLSNSAFVGTCKPCSFAVDGRWDVPLLGFDVYETIHLKGNPESGAGAARVAYYVIAGNSSAFAYASDIIQARIARPAESWSIYYQMLAAWGGAMIYPEALAIGYWAFSNTTP